ncbi:nucleoside 2-deoxyribosyltransferase [Candidatus Bathyarchaeota archaeon]|nr:nucleoside 2-deoxyribosyltransferase [Candidatus Bathyarchaeota archaeon]
MKIFLAAPLFSEAEREFNSKIAKRLRESGFEVWLAQEAPFIQQEAHKEKKTIYEGDILALKRSDVVVAVLDGIDVDAGVAFEIGYAKALGKLVIGLKTDYRTFSRMEEVNLMLEVPMIKICKTVSDVTDSLSKIK